MTASISRRGFHSASLAAVASMQFCQSASADPQDDGDGAFRFRYMLASCMYGYETLGKILPEIAATGAEAIDLWPKVHGNQWEQMKEMGEARFAELLKKHHTKLGCLTHYKLGPFGLQEAMKVANRFECSTIVTGGKGPKGLQGSELKSAVRAFVEKLQPHLELAEELGVTVAIENHGNNLIESSDSLKWLLEFRPSQHLAVALAPYHLEQHSGRLADLIRKLGDGIQVFYAWQHGMGCMKKLPKEQELLQMPGRGTLDFGPIVQALKGIQYKGWTEIFMHPVPRGVPILDTVNEVTAEINRSRSYLEQQT